VYLPQVPEQVERPRASAPPGASTAGTETTLLVEDNAGVRQLATRMLAAAGFTVLAAASGEEALQVLARHPGPVDLVLTDVVMPGMTGMDMAQRASEARPGIHVLYMSGYIDDEVVRRGVVARDVPLLNKPFTATVLVESVRQALRT
jgi:CheY-like chemotaxis protein